MTFESHVFDNCRNWCSPAPWRHGIFVVVTKQLAYDADGYERGERIHGVIECPYCDVVWPLIEEPECWEQHGEKWKCIEWGPGTAECLECDRVFVDGFDGCFVLNLPEADA